VSAKGEGSKEFVIGEGFLFWGIEVVGVEERRRVISGSRMQFRLEEVRNMAPVWSNRLMSSL
jgi:hypothetical protein